MSNKTHFTMEIPHRMNAEYGMDVGSNIIAHLGTAESNLQREMLAKHHEYQRKREQARGKLQLPKRSSESIDARFHPNSQTITSSPALFHVHHARQSKPEQVFDIWKSTLGTQYHGMDIQHDDYKSRDIHPALQSPAPSVLFDMWNYTVPRGK